MVRFVLATCEYVAVLEAPTNRDARPRVSATIDARDNDHSFQTSNHKDSIPKLTKVSVPHTRKGILAS